MPAEGRIVEVLDAKVVSESSQGSAEWRLVEIENKHGDRIEEWRPFQLDATGKVVAEPAWLPLPGSQNLFLQCPIFEAMFAGSRGPGKRLFNKEKVLTDSGWKEVGEVTFADKLVAPDGTYTRILNIWPSDTGDLYRVSLTDGSSVIADADHNWLTYSGSSGYRDGWRVKTTAMIKDAKDTYSIPLMSAPAPGKRWDRPLDPYIAGLILGDGTMGGARNPTVYTPDQWIIDYLEVAGWRMYDYGKTAKMVQAIGPLCYSSEWKEFFRGMGKGRDKFVPESLLMADPETRLAALQGLMDSDGSCDEGGRCTFTSVSTALAEGVQYLVRSLGGSCSKTWDDRDGQAGGLGRDAELPSRWRVRIQHRNKFNPFRLPRKADRVKPMRAQGSHKIVSIEKVEDGPATCFEVEHPSHLFVCQYFIVTHNSASLLMDFAKDVGKGYGKAWRGVLFRRYYGDLDDIVRKIDDSFPKIFPGFRFLRSKSDYMAKWPDGEALLLRHMKDEDDYPDYHGHEYPWIGWDELCEWESDEAFRLMMSCCRPPVSGVPCRVRASANPYGPGRNWVKRRYQLPQMMNKIIEPPGEMPRVAIHGDLSDNFLLLHANPHYPKQIKQAAKNPAQAKAWISGDWTVTAGGMFDDLWDPEIHILPDFPFDLVPRGWYVDRSYDHGQSSPFSCQWWLESNGEPIQMPDGQIIGGVRGDLILFMEWYGTDGDTNSGVRMPARSIAEGIKDREDDMGMSGFVAAGPADTEIFNASSDREGRSPADDMEEEGVIWERANKSPGSRKRGWELMRKMLKDGLPETDGSRSRPGLFVCARNHWWLELVPTAPRDSKDPDELPPKYEDHSCDSTRYRVAYEPAIASSRSF